MGTGAAEMLSRQAVTHQGQLAFNEDKKKVENERKTNRLLFNKAIQSSMEGGKHGTIF